MKNIKKFSFWLLGIMVVGCTLEKKSAFNRSMQNLTAHYNILFNANDLLVQRQEAYSVSFIDAYDRFLSVYPDTTAKTAAADKVLEDVIAKANTIISTKEQSHYLADAYLVLGKANYLEANFYNATEFLSYVTRSFPKQKNIVQEARVWQARSLMRSGQLRLADTVLRTALDSIFPKQKNIADVYAARLQYDLYAGKYDDAETMAKQAIKYSRDKNHQLRWTFILAQLQDYNHKPADAIVSYTRVANSNASFEMAFNAALNRIGVQQEDKTGQKLNRIDALRRLLRDDKNKDFTDQIYYQIGELFITEGNTDLAVKNFKLSVRSSTKNLNQKGLSYLRIADIDFKDKADYTNAKKYYDSTLTSLLPDYPGYQAIFKKANNLQLLTDKLQIITREDTLQLLARLSDADRLTRIKAMVNAQMLQQRNIGGGKSSALNNQGQLPSASGGTIQSGSNVSTFYFYNSSAVSQGFTDFKRVWGNRQLADNWRRSIKSPNETNNVQVAATVQSLNSGTYPDQPQKSANDVVAIKMQQDLQQSVPLTQEQQVQSNNRILNAYTDIANFYRDVLDDKKEAIAAFEKVLARYPNTPNKPSLYYNLYRLYTGTDQAKSNFYKNLILKEYAESNFAKVILDPDFNQKLDDKNAAFNAFYNQLFNLINKRKYPDAVTEANEMIAQYPNNSFAAQVYYLRTIAQGHLQTLDPFRRELQEIIDKFPDDRLISPLVRQHLTFIDANKADLEKRSPVLLASDEIPFMQRHDDLPPTIVYRPASKLQPVAQAKVITPVTVPPKATTSANVPVPGITGPVKEAPSIFSLKDSTNYYFVINVAVNMVSMAPSRFGIGQFNRANLPGSAIKHQLKAVADHQLIYVGRFVSLATVKEYARAIAPLLPEIMKVPADKYNFFIITQENLDKLADKKTLDSYFDFYQKKY